MNSTASRKSSATPTDWEASGPQPQQFPRHASLSRALPPTPTQFKVSPPDELLPRVVHPRRKRQFKEPQLEPIWAPPPLFVLPICFEAPEEQKKEKEGEEANPTLGGRNAAGL